MRTLLLVLLPLDLAMVKNMLQLVCWTKEKVEEHKPVTPQPKSRS